MDKPMTTEEAVAKLQNALDTLKLHGITSPYYDEALRTLAAARGKGEWQAMDGAPIDGTEIIAGIWVSHVDGQVYFERHAVWADPETGEINPDAYQGWAWSDYEVWQHLPPPPVLIREQPADE